MRILISDAEYIITIDPQRRVIRHGSLSIEDGRIDKVGAKDEVEKAYRKGHFDRVIPCRRKVVTPGFIQTHVHTMEHLARGLFPDDVNTGDWTSKWAYPFYGTTTPQSEYVSALLCCEDMLTTGTTCFLESGVRYPESLVKAVDETGIRAAAGPRVMDNPPKVRPSTWTESLVDSLFFKSADEAIKVLVESVRILDGQAHGRISAFITMNGKKTCTDELYVKASDLSTKLDLGIHYHLASSMEEAVQSEKDYGCWPVTHIERLGALQERTVLAHATAVKDEEVKILADRGVKVSFCPGSALKLGKGASTLGKFPEMLKASVTVSLGSDGAAAAGSFDMVRQIQMAAGILKDGRRNPACITTEQCLEMGTIGGAAALRRTADLGSLEPGKQADVVIFDVRHPSWLPLTDPVDNLVYSASGDSVETVLVNGNVVVERGKLTRVGEEKILNLVEQEVGASIQRSGLKPIHRWNYV